MLASRQKETDRTVKPLADIRVAAHASFHPTVASWRPNRQARRKLHRHKSKSASLRKPANSIRRHATRSRRTSGTDLNRPRPITHTFDPDPSWSPVTTRRQLSVRRRRVSAGRRRTISTRRRRRTIGIRRRRRAISTRRRRIISRRRRVVTRRRAVGDSATDNRASGEAAENAGADSAAVTAGICRSRSGQSSKANARSADKRNERLMHKFSS